MMGDVEQSSSLYPGSFDYRGHRLIRKFERAHGADWREFPRHRIRYQIHRWRQIGSPPRVLQWLTQGCKLPLKRHPPPFNQGVSSFQGPALEAWTELRSSYIRVGAIQPATQATHVSRAFLIPKQVGGIASGKWRLIVDFRVLNLSLGDLRFKYSSLKDLVHRMERGSYMVSFDLQDAFFHVPVAVGDRKFLTVNINGELLEFTTIPFGLKCSPYIFEHVMRPVVGILQNPRGVCRKEPSGQFLATYWRANLAVNVLPYLDDFLLWTSDRESCGWLAQLIVGICDELGLSLKMEKSQLTPTQMLNHLGIMVDSRNLRFVAPPEAIRKTKQLASDLLQVARLHRASARSIAKFTGKAQSLGLAVPTIRFFQVHLHRCLATKTSWKDKVWLSRGALKELEFWSKFLERYQSKSFDPGIRPSWILETDASCSGWGAYLHSAGEESPPLLASGFWTTKEASQHINVLELDALLRAVRMWVSNFAPGVLEVVTDNMVVFHLIRNFANTSTDLWEKLVQLHTLLDLHELVLQPRWVPSESNVWADSLSRVMDKADWSLARGLFCRVQEIFGPLQVDLFASSANNLLDRFCSL